MYLVDKKKIKQKAKIITRSNLAQQGYKFNQITGGKWLDGNTVVSCGQDGNVKVWDINWQN